MAHTSVNLAFVWECRYSVIMSEEIRSEKVVSLPSSRATYTKKPPEFWEMLAGEFLEGGISMAVLAEKYGVSPPLLRYHLEKISTGGVLERRKAFLEKAKEVGETLAIQEKEKGKAWTEEQLERCYTFRDKIDEQLLGNPEVNAKEVAYLSSAEERIDRVARRSLGMEDKIGIHGSIDVHGIVGVAVRVIEQKLATGADIPVDAEFELVKEVDSVDGIIGQTNQE